MSERCENCRYSMVSRNGQWLSCHREPPRHITAGNYGGHAQWPTVPPESWCGEWREREEVTRDREAARVMQEVQMRKDALRMQEEIVERMKTQFTFDEP